MNRLSILFILFPSLCFGGPPFTAPQSIDLSGSNYFTSLHTYDDETGAISILYDTVGAFLWTPGLDLTQWSGKNVRVTDGIEFSYGVITGAGGGLTLGSELHTDANAISDPNSNEANATTGWASSGIAGVGANVFASQSGVANVGTYAIEASTNDTPSSNANVSKDIGTDWSLVVGQTYSLSFDWRHVGTGSSWGSALNDTGNKNTPTFSLDSASSSDTTFSTVTHNFAYNSDYQYIVFYESSTPADGGVYIDNLSLKAITDGPANETITVDSWVDSGVDPTILIGIEVLDNPAVTNPDPIFPWR